MRGENLRSIYIFLFLHAAFFLLQMQSAERFHAAFAFNPDLVLSGEIWRAVTYVFVSGSFIRSLLIGFFFLMLILYILGGAIEQEFGTRDLVTLFLISTLLPVLLMLVTRPGVLFAEPVFVYYTLMIIYGDRYGDAVFYLIIIPVKARWLAWFAVALLVLGVFGAPRVYVPIAAGVGAAWGYYRVFMAGGRRIRVPSGFKAVRGVVDSASAEKEARANLDQFQETKRIAEEGTGEEQQLRIEHLEERITPGVNICPPVDFKPEDEDGYCARCEGFNECSARWLRAQIEDRDDSGVGSSSGSS